MLHYIFYKHIGTTTVLKKKIAKDYANDAEKLYAKIMHKMMLVVLKCDANDAKNYA